MFDIYRKLKTKANCFLFSRETCHLTTVEGHINFNQGLIAHQQVSAYKVSRDCGYNQGELGNHHKSICSDMDNIYDGRTPYLVYFSFMLAAALQVWYINLGVHVNRSSVCGRRGLQYKNMFENMAICCSQMQIDNILDICACFYFLDILVTISGTLWCPTNGYSWIIMLLYFSKLKYITHSPPIYIYICIVK